MPTASLTTSPTTIDSGASGSVTIANTGTTRVTFVNGGQRSTINPNRSYDGAVQGVVTVFVTAQDGSTGTVTWEVSGVRQDIVTYNEMSTELSAEVTARNAAIVAERATERAHQSATYATVVKETSPGVYPARPSSAAYVRWIGSAQPADPATGDEWVDTSGTA